LDHPLKKRAFYTFLFFAVFFIVAKLYFLGLNLFGIEDETLFYIASEAAAGCLWVVFFGVFMLYCMTGNLGSRLAGALIFVPETGILMAEFLLPLYSHVGYAFVLILIIIIWALYPFMVYFTGRFMGYFIERLFPETHERHAVKIAEGA